MSPEVVIPADIRFPLERANGVQVVKTAAALARAGSSTTLVVRWSDRRPSEEILALYGVSPEPLLAVRRLAVAHRQGSFVLPRALFLLQATAGALSALRSGRIVYTRDLQLADLLVRLRPGGRIVYEAHAVESLRYRETNRKAARLTRRERRVWRGARGFVTITAGIGQALAESHGARTRAPVIPSGCDVPRSREFPGLAVERPPRVVYAGQLYPWKGVDVLVEAMASVPAARLVILGGLAGEPDLDRIRSLVAARGLGERTEMLGTVPPARVPEALRKAAVVVVPVVKTPWTERCISPVKAFEAMAAGRPIVASDLPANREILSDGENAILVPPGDPSSLARAIRRVLDDGPLAECLARRAFADAADYSWDTRARRLAGLFEELA